MMISSSARVKDCCFVLAGVSGDLGGVYTLSFPIAACTWDDLSALLRHHHCCRGTGGLGFACVLW